MATESKAEIRRLFESGDVYADRWTTEIRAALDVADPLLPAVLAALDAGKSVVLSGNAGDGKSHLAQRALDSRTTRRCVEVTKQHPVPGSVQANSIVFVRDASGLSDSDVLAATKTATDAGAPLLITINEGPLTSLAGQPGGEFYARVRDTLHRRSVGDLPEDPDDCLILNLSGRQLTRAGFVIGALDRLLPVVGPCGTCGKSQSCPRVVGAKLLRKSIRAKTRVELLLRLLTDGGRHMSAREIWVFLIDLFFGWVCPPLAGDESRAAGFFWMRIFDGETPAAMEIREEFDPLTVPMAKEDIDIWLGRFDNLNSEVEYPGIAPVVVARDDEQAALDAFASAKRCFFFFGKDLDVDTLLKRQSLAPRFGDLLDQAIREPRPVVRNLAGLINQYRLAVDTENELWVSRHHGCAAHRRPFGIGAAAKLSIDQVEVSVPHKFEAQRFPDAGFFPTKVFLRWRGSDQLLEFTYRTWMQVMEERTLTVDREQELLDFALDLFMAQAPVEASDDPEIIVYDHLRREETYLRIRPDDRKIEVLR